jgi:hypothetical protein
MLPFCSAVEDEPIAHIAGIIGQLHHNTQFHGGTFIELSGTGE